MSRKQINISTNEAQYASLERRATEELLTVSEYVRDRVLPPIDKLFHLASGGRYPRSMVNMVLAAAEEAADRPDLRGTAVVDWLSSASALVRWLEANPWHPESYSRTVALMDSIPKEIKSTIEAGLRDLLK